MFIKTQFWKKKQGELERKKSLKIDKEGKKETAATDLFGSKTPDGKHFRDVSFTESSLSSCDSNLEDQEIKMKTKKAQEEDNDEDFDDCNSWLQFMVVKPDS